MQGRYLLQTALTINTPTKLQFFHVIRAQAGIQAL
jgi:hypothetical protein